MATIKHTVKHNKFPEMEAALEVLNGRKVNVGHLDGGETAWLAAIHEYGLQIEVTPAMRAYLHGQGLHLKATTTHITIPERSFLRSGYDASKDEVLRQVGDLLPAVMSGSMDTEKFLQTIGLLLKGKIQTYARDLDSPANHEFTIKRKDSTNPLVQSGDMIDRITYEVE